MNPNTVSIYYIHPISYFHLDVALFVPLTVARRNKFRSLHNIRLLFSMATLVTLMWKTVLPPTPPSSCVHCQRDVTSGASGRGRRSIGVDGVGGGLPRQLEPGQAWFWQFTRITLHRDKDNLCLLGDYSLLAKRTSKYLLIYSSIACLACRLDCCGWDFPSNNTCLPTRDMMFLIWFFLFASCLFLDVCVTEDCLTG